MTPRIALFGGSFNPPGTHHRRLAEELLRRFDTVVIVPCGPRPDKRGTGEVDPLHRAAMVDRNFRGMEGVEVELFDLERATFTRTFELAELYRHRGEVWIVAGSDLIAGGARGVAEIQREWARGEELWRKERFAVVPRAGSPLAREDLPPRAEVIEIELEGSSSAIREKVFRRESIAGLVTPGVQEIVERYELYTGNLTRRHTEVRWERPRCLLFADERNPAALELRDRFADLEDPDNPDLILVIGGDGTMLHAIREHWRRRVPFLGVNAGHRGFLLNETPADLRPEFLASRFVMYHLALLYVETQAPDGTENDYRAFNDTWVERTAGQAVWLEVTVDGRVRIPRLVADGLLVSTAPGSTAYARAMGATPLLVDSKALLVVGANPMEPPSWKSAHLSLGATVEVRNLEPARRPVRAFVDGVAEGEVVLLRARLSRTAAVELVFTAGHDMAEKLTQIQFP